MVSNGRVTVWRWGVFSAHGLLLATADSREDAELLALDGESVREVTVTYAET